jgi:Nuf2 family
MTEEDIQANPAVLDHVGALPYPSLHHDFTDLNLFLALKHLFATCGYGKFSWRDLHAPTLKRLRNQLSAVINLAKFREEQLKVYAELNGPVCIHVVVVVAR